MKREYEFKLYRGVVKFFAYTPLNNPVRDTDNVLYWYDRKSVTECERLTLGMDGLE